VFEDGQPIKANPLAWWEFKDCMEYLERNGLERHPLHDQASTLLINLCYYYRGGNP
jgi:3'-phosphoadenosine 5'-phosphosulfate sulfotransferase (PAPS reductase)/FAD synthetase